MNDTNIIYKCCVLSSPRIGQAWAGSQQKESTPNSKLVWSLLIEYKISIRTQISCLSFGSCRLLLLPYALLALRFVKSDNGNVLQRFFTIITTFHWISILQIMFLWRVAQPSVRQHRMSTSVNANIRVPAGPSVRQQQYTWFLKNDINLPTALNNSRHNYVFSCYSKYLTQQLFYCAWW